MTSIEPRYAPLFEPLRIGPVSAPNRFYQVPHCTGMGFALPRTLAAMRGIKAEGGWGVVCTERWAADDDEAAPGERREMFSMLAESPDLWDVTVNDYAHEMGSSRFVDEASLEPLISWVKPLTSKPLVSVGRFTSPDAMVGQLRRGVMDLGGKRPSSLPKKKPPVRLLVLAVSTGPSFRACLGG